MGCQSVWGHCAHTFTHSFTSWVNFVSPIFWEVGRDWRAKFKFHYWNWYINIIIFILSVTTLAGWDTHSISPQSSDIEIKHICINCWILCGKRTSQSLYSTLRKTHLSVTKFTKYLGHYFCTVGILYIELHYLNQHYSLNWDSWYVYIATWKIRCILKGFSLL